MQTRISNRAPASWAIRAFSLVELLTAVSIMIVIIYSLYAMFNRTQKALRSNVTQVDVLEAGRATAEMLGRDLEQLSPCNLSQTANVYADYAAYPFPPSPPLVQVDVNEKAVLRTNLLQEFFFLRRQTNSWIGTGYRVIDTNNVGVGILYRYTITTNYYLLNRTNLINRFLFASPIIDPRSGIITNFDRVADGIVHFRLTAYDPQGRRMGWETTNMSPSYSILRLTKSGTKLGLTSTAINALDAQVILRQTPPAYNTSAYETQFAFNSNAVPAYLELELGILEPATFKQYQSFIVPGVPSTLTQAQAFLRRQAGKVHLFRQRIPIRTAQQ